MIDFLHNRDLSDITCDKYGNLDTYDGNFRIRRVIQYASPTKVPGHLWNHPPRSSRFVRFIERFERWIHS